MISYGDMTYCPFWRECQQKMCFRALTDNVKKLAREWWGSDDPPLAVYIDKPWCFKDRRLLNE